MGMCPVCVLGGKKLGLQLYRVLSAGGSQPVVDKETEPRFIYT